MGNQLSVILAYTNNTQSMPIIKKLKQILYTTVLIMSNYNFVNAAVTGQYYCIYGNNTYAAAGGGSITGEIYFINGIEFIYPKAMFSYDVPMSNCPLIGNKLIKGVVANIGKDDYPYIYNYPVLTPDGNYTEILNSYVGGTIQQNLLGALRNMLDLSTNFTEYTNDYKKLTLLLEINGVLHIYDNEGDSDIFKQPPKNYKEAKGTLKDFLMSQQIGGTTAGLVSSFISKYFAEGGYAAIPDILTDRNQSSFSRGIGNDTPHIKIKISQDPSGNPLLELTFCKKINSFENTITKDRIQQAEVLNSKIKLTINKNKSQEDGKLSITLANGPLDNMIIDPVPGGSNGDLVRQSIFSSYINNYGMNQPKRNQDEFMTRSNLNNFIANEEEDIDQH